MTKLKIECAKGSCPAGDVLDVQDHGPKGRWYLVRVTDFDVLVAMGYEYTDPLISAGGVLVYAIIGAFFGNDTAHNIREGCHFRGED